MVSEVVTVCASSPWFRRQHLLGSEHIYHLALWFVFSPVFRVPNSNGSCESRVSNVACDPNSASFIQQSASVFLSRFVLLIYPVFSDITPDVASNPRC